MNLIKTRAGIMYQHLGLLAVQLTLLIFGRSKLVEAVIFQTNNKTFLKYPLKMGGTKNQKFIESKKFHIGTLTTQF